MTINILYFGSQAFEFDFYLNKREFEYKSERIELDSPINEPESIETHFESYKTNLHVSDSDEFWAILVAGNAINFGVLAVLEKFNTKNIKIVYIIPDTTFFGDFSKMCHKIVYNILQEYARSGKFQKICLFDFQEIEKGLDNLNFENYNEVMFDAVAYTLVTDYNLKFIKPKHQTTKEEDESARIETYGILNINTNKENLMYDLQYPREIIYKYIVDKEKIRMPSFRKNIINFLKTQGTNNTKAYFELYEMEGQNLCLVVRKSSLIQK